MGHENNLRSLIKRLDGISETDILQLELPRAIPLIYDLDATTFKPIKSVKVNIDSGSGSTETKMLIDAYKGVGVEVELLSGRYICDSTQLKNIAKRDQQQVYDLRYKNTLETAPYLGNNPISVEKLSTPSAPAPIPTHTPAQAHTKAKKEIKETKVAWVAFTLLALSLHDTTPQN